MAGFDSHWRGSGVQMRTGSYLWVGTDEVGM